jgi:4-hydroxy-tetrahydrodipicolinate synthase
MVTRSRVIEQFPVIASLKAMTARRTGHEGWTRVRPPLRALDAAATERLFAELDSGAIPA